MNSKVKNKKNKTPKLIIAFGIFLILIGLFMKVPGNHLVTYSSHDNRNSEIEEYVGGDAYNYIIGASLVAGRIAGTMAAKAILVVGGSLIICMTLLNTAKRDEENQLQQLKNSDNFQYQASRTYTVNNSAETEQ